MRQLRNKREFANRINLEPSESCGVGLIASIKNQPARDVLTLALRALSNVTHRGAIGADGKTGDGCGVSATMPHRIVSKWLSQLGISDPPPLLGVAMVFLPREAEPRKNALHFVCDQITASGLRVIAIRNVPVNSSVLGPIAATTEPDVVQVFVSTAREDRSEFERQMFLVRRSIELTPPTPSQPPIHIASFSSETIVYKAMVLSKYLADYYRDLNESDFHCSACIYHQRFSTNTAPEWELCQPFRVLAHNGEINTIRGNRNWMTARETSFQHEFWTQHPHAIRRLFNFHESDSASLDHVVELLNQSGRGLDHVLTMLIPPAWENDPRVSEAQRSFYRYHSCFCEPWDGPSAIVAQNGKAAVAILDRNGLRPLRYKITVDDLLIVGSEVGAERIDDRQVVRKGRLGPGQLIAVDFVSKQIRFDHEIKSELAARKPYAQWLDQFCTAFSAKPSNRPNNFLDDEHRFQRLQIAAGLSQEETEIGIKQMAMNGSEPTFSMGVDTPLAFLSQQSRHLADYFKQRFAQVTNPPIDPIREQSVMSLQAGLGPERNILDETPHHCQVLELPNPVLLPHEFEQLKTTLPYTFHTIDCTWSREKGSSGLETALKEIVLRAQLAVETQATVLILSDRCVDSERVAIPMLLAVGAIHHGLYRSGQRLMCSLVAETSWVRDSHQLALLLGYGCTAVYPYLAYGTIQQLHQEEEFETAAITELWTRCRQALEQGLLKIMSKMGISVLNSYQGAQLFEAIGLGPEVIETCFQYSHANLHGVGFHELATDCIWHHDRAFARDEDSLTLSTLGLSKPKRAGEHHAITGKVTKQLHQFVRGHKGQSFSDFSSTLKTDHPVAIRDLLKMVDNDRTPVPLDSVESAEHICERFTTAAMSLGAISPEAHEAIAIAMNTIGGKSNSGEGGEDPARFKRQPDGTLAISKIKQVASGRFGVDPQYLTAAEEIEIKMAQGAKPGEGGQLPGFKVNELIARLRNTALGVTLISPPPHHDIYSIEDLAQLIYDLKMVNPRARVCVKLVAKSGVGGICVGVAKSNADAILISGHEGGTGASPLTSIRHAGLPWEIGLAEAHQSLVASGLRDRLILRADGGLKTGLDVVLAALFGAEEFNFGTMALIALGCVYVKKCHLNNCPVGIATQDPKFRDKFKGQPENLIAYLRGVASEVRTWLATQGFHSIDEIVGRTDLLEQTPSDQHQRQKGVSLTALLSRSAPANLSLATRSEKYSAPPKPMPSFDDRYVFELSSQSLADERPILVDRQATITNTDRNIGTRLSGELAQRFGIQNTQAVDITLRLSGSAGQSLGAFLAPGIKIYVEGEANDYVGKGMCGGEIVLRPSSASPLESWRNVIAGNSILYGATGGTLYASGQVAERFCVRNSGARAVVEGCGDHGCEYMTRGTVVVLGPVGNNFAAGMTGGTAFVWDRDKNLEMLINPQTIHISSPDGQDFDLLRTLIEDFEMKTGSRRAQQILTEWSEMRSVFRRVAPVTTPGNPQRTVSASNAPT